MALISFQKSAARADLASLRAVASLLVMSTVKTRVMYIQRGLSAGRIGRVRSSKTGRTLYYGDVVLESLAGRGYKANFIDLATNDMYWVSGPRRDGQDTLYPGVVEIDEPVIEEYWRDIRGEPGRRDKTFRSTGVHAKHAIR